MEEIRRSPKALIAGSNVIRMELIEEGLPEDGGVWLKVCVDHAKGQFYYSTDGTNYRKAGAEFDASKLSDEYNRPLSFTGPYVGIGCQDLAKAEKTADFAYFRYTEKEERG